jgi:small subunit ribosomal protein S17
MADETPDTNEAADAAPEAEAAPEEQLPPKEARRRARQRQTTSRRPSTPEERVALRRAKAAARRRRRQQEKARRTEPGQGTPPAPPRRGTPQVRTGTVVSDKADKTITVRIDIVRRHRRYGKIIRSSATLHAHDAANDAHAGDLVRVVESRPLSRTKRWRLVDVLERAK